MSGKYRKDHNCLNCGFHVEEHYCSRCGQPNLELKEDFWQFISHSIAHYFHFDNKFFKTLVPLVSQPGKVTLDYLAGKRARYINPISMYIFVSIVYFIVVYAPEKIEKTNNTVNIVRSKPILDSISSPLSGIVNKKIVDRTQQAINEGFDRKAFAALPFKQQDTILRNLKTQYQITKSDSLANLIKKLEPIYITSNDSTYAAYLVRQKALPATERDNMIERFMVKRQIGIGQNSEIIQEQLNHNRPKQYFLFMPLMALFIMINFRKNNIRYLDHLIFTIHGMTAFFLVSSIVQPFKRFLLPNSSLSGIVELLLIGWICWYLFKSLKIFYQRKTSTTIWRMIWVIVLYGISVKVSEMIIVNIIYYVAT
jgi:ribosomal protein L37E